MISTKYQDFLRAYRKATGKRVDFETRIVVEKEAELSNVLNDFDDWSKLDDFVNSVDKTADDWSNFANFLRFVGIDCDDVKRGRVAGTTATTSATPKRETATTSTNDDKVKQLIELLASMQGGQIDAEQVRAIVREELAGVKPSKHEFIINNETRAKIDGVLPACFDDLLKCLLFGLNVYMYGEAGTGKTTTARQLCEAMGRIDDFLPVAKVTYAEELRGYMDANGKYVPAPLYTAMKQGKVLFIDEMDASDPSALVAINTAVDNKYYTFPNGETVTAHDGFRVIGAGNTIMLGADNQYTGRQTLDASTVNRFFCQYVGYDKRIETACAKNNSALLEFVYAIRKGAKSIGLNIVVSYRAIISIVQLESAGIPLSNIIAGVILKGMNAEDKRRLIASMVIDNDNAYFTALKRA